MSNNSSFRGLYLLIFLCCFIIVFSFKCPAALDIIRYYESAQSAVQSYINVEDYVFLQISENVDFIYTSILFIFAKYGISLDIVTSLIISFYYIFIAKIICKVAETKFNKIIFLYAILSAPLVWVITISRNVAAFTLFYVAVYYLINHDFKRCLIFCILSIFTHISLIVYVLLLALSYLFEKNNVLNIRVRNIVLIAIIIIAYFMPLSLDYLNVHFSNFLSGSRYEDYLYTSRSAILETSNLGIGDKIPIIFIYLLSIILLLLDKNKSFLYWFYYFIIILLSFAIHSNIMMTQRYILILPAFIGVALFSIRSRMQSQSGYLSLSLLSICGIIIMLGGIYTYRNVFI